MNIFFLVIYAAHSNMHVCVTVSARFKINSNNFDELNNVQYLLKSKVIFSFLSMVEQL